MRIEEIECIKNEHPILPKNLPRKSGAYFYSDLDGNVIQVGHACDFSANCGPSELLKRARAGEVMLRIKPYDAYFTPRIAKHVIAGIEQELRCVSQK